MITRESIDPVWNEVTKIDSNPDAKVAISSSRDEIYEIIRQFIKDEESCFLFFTPENPHTESSVILEILKKEESMDFLIAKDDGSILAITEEEYQYYVYKRNMQCQPDGGHNSGSSAASIVTP